MSRLFGLLMFVFASIAGVAMPASADDTILQHPSETGIVSVNGARMIAFYRGHGESLAVTIVISESDGAVLRSSVVLRDGQRHAIAIAADIDEDLSERTVFRMTRNGASILLSAATEQPMVAMR